MSVALGVTRIGLGLGIAAVLAYGSGALWFRGPSRRAWRRLLWLAWVLLGAAALIDATMGGWRIVAAFAPAAAVFGGWWTTIRPRLDRPWAADVERMLEVTRQGDGTVRLRHVRNFDWHGRDDFTPRWEVRDCDPAQLVAVDLAVSYWRGPAIAHTLVSFAFADGGHVVFSVEVRRVVGETFSALGGLFRQCELVVIAADERDILRTRTNARGEDVFLYRVALPRDRIRALLMAYLDTAESLHRQPRFYHTLTSNCTTLVYDMVKAIVPGVPWDWRLIASGYLPAYLYELGALDTRLSLAELRRRGHINARALAADVDGSASDDFSDAIRRGLPAPTGCAQPPP